MSSNLTTIAAQFTDLFLEHDWRSGYKPSDEELQILLNVILAAGFEAKAVVPEELLGHCRDADGSITGEKYKVNSYCSLKVLSEEGGDYYRATGWLGWLFNKAVSCNGRQTIIETVLSEIKRSIPLEPIRLTEEGDFLEESLGEGCAPNHTRDDNNLGSCIGIHKYCRGWVDRHRATEKLDVLVCRKCHLRVYIPKNVATYGRLRQVLRLKTTWV